MDFHLAAHPVNAFEDAACSFDADRIASASADIRNALVPLKTIADVLHRRDDVESRAWCVRMLQVEVKRIVDILDTL